MSSSGWVRQGLSIGRTEFRRTTRSLRGDSARLALLGVVAVLFGLMVLAGTWFILQFGDQIPAGDVSNVIRGSVAIQWLFAVFITAQRAGSRHHSIDQESLMLLTVPVRAVALGLLSAECFRALAYFAVPVLLLGGAFVVASGSPVMAPFLALAVLLFLATALVLGFALGLLAKLLVARHRVVAEHKSAFSFLAVIVFVGGYVGLQNLGGQGLTALLGWLPFSWIVDLAVIGSPFSGSLPRAAAILVGGLVWVLGGVLIVERLGVALWFGDTVEDAVAAEQARVDTGTAADPLAAAVRPIPLPTIGQPARRVAQRSVVVARRNPQRLSFLVLPVVLGGVTLVNIAQAGVGSLLALLPPLVVVALPWLAGAVFGLNPLGDEGAALPATLTSLASGRDYAVGLALPGLTLGLPVVVLATVATGLAGPYAPLETVALAVIAFVLTLAAVVIAPAVGMAFPRYDPVQVGSDREIVPPSLSAVVLYSLTLGVPGALAAAAILAPAGTRRFLSLLVGGLLSVPFALLAGQGFDPARGVVRWLGQVGAEIATVPVSAVRWGGYVLPLAALCLFGIWAFRSVTRRFRLHTLD
jgi:ABC-2 type transport system permease protein